MTGERYASATLVRVVKDPPFAFVAGLLVEDGVIVFTAPILRHYRGQTFDRFWLGAQRLGFRLRVLR